MSAAIFIRYCSRELNQPVFRRVLFLCYSFLLYRLSTLYFHIVDIPFMLYEKAILPVCLDGIMVSFEKELHQRKGIRVSNGEIKVQLTKLVKTLIKRAKSYSTAKQVRDRSQSMKSTTRR